MKIVILLIILFPIALKAQNLPGGVSDREYYNDRENSKQTFFLELAARMPRIIDDYGFELGARLGPKLTENFGIGINLGYLLTHNIELDNPNFSVPAHLRLFYGTLDAEYELFLGKYFSLSGLISLGFGSANYSTRRDIDIRGGSSDQWFALTEPTIRIFYFLSDDFGISPGIGWRQSFGFDMAGHDDSDFSGPVISLSLSSRMFEN